MNLLENLILSFTEANIWTNPILQAFVIGCIRVIPGWLEHSWKNGKITWPELKQLGQTWMRMIPQIIGWGALGVPAPAALVTDVFVTKAAKVADGKKK